MVRLEITLCQDNYGDGDFDHETLAAIQVIAERLSINQVKSAVDIFMVGAGYAPEAVEILDEGEEWE